MVKIGTCLWFDGDAEDAAKLYSHAFENFEASHASQHTEATSQASAQKPKSALGVEFILEGLSVLALNGGPTFKHSPSLSFFVTVQSEAEVARLWQTLSKNGKVRMGLDKYPWSEKYGWTTDRFGVEWQIMFSPTIKKLAPAFLFVDKLFGKGEEAINFYTSTVENSKIDTLHRDEKTSSVLHGAFTLAGQDFVLMEGQGEHHHSFTPAFSIVLSCDTQAQIDTYWSTLSEGGRPDRCGWLTDKYGVSWQIVPTQLGKWMGGADRLKAERVSKQLMQMNKIDIATLESAYTE